MSSINIKQTTGTLYASTLSHFLDADEGALIGNPARIISKPSSIRNARPGSLVFYHKHTESNKALIKDIKGLVVLCSPRVDAEDMNEAENTYIVIDNPRLAFAKIVGHYFVNKVPPSGIHKTAIVSPTAQIHDSAYVGPYCNIGDNCIVGPSSFLYSHVVLYENVTIGSNVIINASTVIGTDGFGYEKDPITQEMIKIHHIGGVEIQDNVEIGSNVSIDRGTLDNTVIKRGAKIDNLVHVAHNVEIGENTVVIALSMIGGSTKIGCNSWIAPGACLLNGISIGKSSTVGMGAIVVKTVGDNLTVAGNPARPIEEIKILVKEQLNTIKNAKIISGYPRD